MDRGELINKSKDELIDMLIESDKDCKEILDLMSKLSSISADAEALNPNDVSSLIFMVQKLKDAEDKGQETFSLLMNLLSQYEKAKTSWDEIYSFIYEMRDLSIFPR